MELSTLLPLLISLDYYSITQCDVALYPQGRVPVCVEDTLPEFECTLAPGRQLLEWRVNIIMMVENETMVDSYSRLVDTSGQVPGLMTHSIVFNFVTSAISPLMSTLSISGVTGNLTSIEVICVDRVEQTSSSALMHIINRDQSLNFQLTEINITTESEQLDRDRILVVLKWGNEEPASDFVQFISYTISAIPQVALRLLERTRVEVEVLYNIYYVVTIVGVPPCKVDNISSSIVLYYANCSNPAALITASVFIDVDQSDSYIPGDNVTFYCPTGLVLTGPNTSTCMRNGEWEPDRREVKCEAGTIVKCMSETTTAVLVSSIMSTALFTFIITFVIGCTCGVCFVKRCQTPRDDGSHSHDMYEVVMHHSERTDNELQQDVELQQNVAYAPISANQ